MKRSDVSRFELTKDRMRLRLQKSLLHLHHRLHHQLHHRHPMQQQHPRDSQLEWAEGLERVCSALLAPLTCDVSRTVSILILGCFAMRALQLHGLKRHYLSCGLWKVCQFDTCLKDLPFIVFMCRHESDVVWPFCPFVSSSRAGLADRVECEWWRSSPWTSWPNVKDPISKQRWLSWWIIGASGPPWVLLTSN